MDALIAAHVMGWRQLELRPVPNAGESSEPTEASSQLYGRDARTHSAKGQLQRVPRYSADESISLQQNLQARGWYVTTSGSPRSDVPQITVTISIPYGPEFHGTAATHDLALCRAALLTVESLRPAGEEPIKLSLPPVRGLSPPDTADVAGTHPAAPPAGAPTLTVPLTGRAELSEPLGVPKRLSLPQAGPAHQLAPSAAIEEEKNKGRVIESAPPGAVHRIARAAMGALLSLRSGMPAMATTRQLVTRFGRAEAPPSLAHELSSLEQEAEAASGSERAEILAAAAGLCFESRDLSRALVYYGRAVDTYLGARHFDAASEICLQMIDLSPQVVRARGTLAFLTLGKEIFFYPLDEQWRAALRETGALVDPPRPLLDHVRSTEKIGDYVRAARGAGQESAVVRRLRLIAEATEVSGVQEVIGGYLLTLGDAEGADEVLGMAARMPDDPPPGDPRERWAEVLRAPVIDQQGV